VVVLKKLGWPLAVALGLGSALVLIGSGFWAIPLVSALVLLVAMPVMQSLPWSLPPLNHLGTRNLGQVEVETRALVGFALAYPVLLVALALLARAVPASLIPEVSSPLLSPLLLVGGNVLLLGVPTLLFAARLGNFTRQLGLRRINSPWRWLGPVVPIALMGFALGALGACGRLPGSVGPYLIALPLAATAIAFPEEAFYRILLQTRLELLLGTRSGIAVASLLFGLMQVPVRLVLFSSVIFSNPHQAVMLSLATAIAVQSVLGVVYGFMWMRYRNAWVNFGAHSAIDAMILAALIAR
jgi:membrane protease YdiL (CAAX protease family)